jgi:hypothetical protein
MAYRRRLRSHETLALFATLFALAGCRSAHHGDPRPRIRSESWREDPGRSEVPGAGIQKRADPEFKYDLDTDPTANGPFRPKVTITSTDDRDELYTVKLWIVEQETANLAVSDTSSTPVILNFRKSQLPMAVVWTATTVKPDTADQHVKTRLRYTVNGGAEKQTTVLDKTILGFLTTGRTREAAPRPRAGRPERRKRDRRAPSASAFAAPPRDFREAVSREVPMRG